MAQPANLFDRVDVNPSVREDLIDKIYNVSPEEVPVTTAFGKGTATNTLHEWQRDALATANKDNAMIDGDDVSLDAQVATERVGNHLQIFSKKPGVSRDRTKPLVVWTFKFVGGKIEHVGDIL